MADNHKNFSYSLVTVAPSPNPTTGISLTIGSGDGTKFPIPPFNATVWPANQQPTTTNAEIVRVTGISTDTFTIIRTQESTSARSIQVGDQIAATITVKTLSDIETDVSTNTTNINLKVAKTGDTMTGLLQWTGTGHAGVKLNDLTTVARDALAPSAGMMIYNSTVDKIQKWEDATQVWENLAVNPATKVVAPASSGYTADYYTDGTADQVEINAAINSFPAEGGTLLLREGTYTLADQIITKSNVAIAGSGYSTIITCINEFNKDLIINTDQVNGNSNMVVRDLKIDGNKANQSSGVGVGIYFDGTSTNCTNVHFENLWLINTAQHGLHPKRTNKLFIKGCYLQTCGTSISLDHGIYLLACNQVVVTNCIFDSNAANGFNAKQGTHINISNCLAISNGGRGFRVADSSYVSVNGNIAESNLTTGIILNLESSGGIFFASITGNICRNNRTEGILVSSAADVTISGNTCSENKFEGVRMRNTARGVITGNLCTGSSNGLNNTYSGIMVDGTSSFVTVVGNTSTRTASAQQRYGIELKDTADYLFVSNNNFSTNFTAGISLTTSGTNLVIANNFGINPLRLYTQGNMTGATTITRVNGSKITGTLTGNITVTLDSGLIVGDEMTLVLTQDATGSRTVTWPSNFKKAGGTLTLTIDASAVDSVSMVWDGTNWRETGRSMNLS